MSGLPVQNGKRDGGEEARPRRSKEWGDGKKRVGQGRIRGRLKRNWERKAGKVKVAAGFSGQVDPLGRVKGMGGSVVGHMRREK